MPKNRLANHIVTGLNERLRQERERLGFSQQEFANRLGISRATQNYFEAGSRQPDLDYLSAFGRNNGNILYLLFADQSEHEYVDVLDWDLFDKVWDWVERVAVDAKGKPYPPDLKKKAFKLAYRACRSCQVEDLEKTDLVTIFSAAA